MRILFLGLNYAPEEIGIAAYTTGLCQYLTEAGHIVQVIAAKPYYPRWEVFHGYKGGWKREKAHGVNITRVPLYVPTTPTGAKRILHHATFALSSLFPMLNAAANLKPDIVITTIPSLVAAPVGWLAARLSGAKCWLHIQDFEVDAALATGLVNEQSVAARLARSLEHRIVRSFDQVSSISPEMCRKVAEFGVPDTRIYEFRNWAEIDRIAPLAGPSAYRAEWNITTKYVALYSGNIANKQGIEIIVSAARFLSNRSDLTFVICGQGPNRSKLEALSSGLKNIRFYDLQPLESLNELMGLATLHLLPQISEAAGLVLPSKMSNMLASGRPIVATAAPDTNLAQEVDGCGLNTPPGDAQAFAAAIANLLDSPERRIAMGVAARARALERWAKPSILAAVEKRMRDLNIPHP